MGRPLSDLMQSPMDCDSTSRSPPRRGRPRRTRDFMRREALERAVMHVMSVPRPVEEIRLELDRTGFRPLPDIQYLAEMIQGMEGLVAHTSPASTGDTTAANVRVRAGSIVYGKVDDLSEESELVVQMRRRNTALGGVLRRISTLYSRHASPNPSASTVGAGAGIGSCSSSGRGGAAAVARG